MFTGLVDCVGKVRRMQKLGNAIKFGVQAEYNGIRLGESIALRGVCLTVVHFEDKYFELEASEETLQRTNLGRLSIGESVNLERALCMGARMGGHWVMGHVDAMARVESIKNEGLGQRISLSFEPALMKYIVEKGSITLDGVSLTVSNLSTNSFGVVLIPHTRSEVDGNFLKIGQSVNVEVDVLGKYIERLLLFQRQEKVDSSVSWELLEKNGFIR